MVMKRTPSQILKILEENQAAIRHYGVLRLGLFGSSARGEGTEQSDLDFLVRFEKKSFDAYMDLKFYLENLFGCRVDLVLEDALKPRLRSNILAETIDAPGFSGLP
jgi:uncharacterized protein